MRLVCFVIFEFVLVLKIIFHNCNSNISFLTGEFVCSVFLVPLVLFSYHMSMLRAEIVICLLQGF